MIVRRGIGLEWFVRGSMSGTVSRRFIAEQTRADSKLPRTPAGKKDQHLAEKDASGKTAESSHGSSKMKKKHNPKFQEAMKSLKEHLLGGGRSDAMHKAEEVEKMCKAVEDAYSEDDEEGEEGDEAEKGMTPEQMAEMEEKKKEAEEARKALEATLDEIQKGTHKVTQDAVNAAVAKAIEDKEDMVSKGFASLTESVNLVLGGIRERIANVEKVLLAQSVVDEERDEAIKSMTAQFDELKKGFTATTDELKKGLVGLPAAAAAAAPIHQPAVTAPKAVTAVPSPLDGTPDNVAKGITHEQIRGAARDMLSKGGLSDHEVDQLNLALKRSGDFWSVGSILEGAPALAAKLTAATAK